MDLSHYPALGSWTKRMIEKDYFARQARTLLRMARVVSNLAISAELLSKAADLEAKIDPPRHIDQIPIDGAGDRTKAR
jgi:hypothetical protein